MKPLALTGRVLFSLVFIVSAASHFRPDTIAWASSAGVPLANILVPASGLLALFAGLCIAAGYRTRLAALGIVAFLVPVTLAMHKFWAIPDPMMAQLQFAMFMKNVSLVGGALFLAYAGAGAYSLDAARARTPVAATA